MYSMCVSGAQWEREGGERRPHYSQRQEFLLSDVAREKGRGGPGRRGTEGAPLAPAGGPGYMRGETPL